MYRRWLLPLSLLLGVVWLTASRPRPPPPPPPFSPTTLVRAPFVDDHSLTVVLPVTPTTLHDLLVPFLVSTNVIYEVAILCPQSLLAHTRRRLRHALPNAPHDHPKVSLYPWSSPTQHHQASLALVARVKTPWVLILDEHGFREIAECDKAYLMRPRAVHVPIGPRGFAGTSHNWSQLSSSDRLQPAAFLVPPFVAPSALLARAPVASSVWPVLGNYVAESTFGSFGGLVIGTEILDTSTCDSRTEFDAPIDDDMNARTLIDPVSPSGFLVLAFPRKEDLINFIPATCKLFHQGYTLLAYLYDAIDQAEFWGVVNEQNCTIPYFWRSTKFPSFSDWLDSLESIPDIVIGLDHQDLVSSMFSWILEQPPFLNTTLMRIPRSELPYTEWIGTLTLQELRNWNVPEITFTVITNNRPHSLRRLLESIQRTLFYGDKVDIRINMDQTSDPETMDIVNDFEWFHGDVFLHHRVIHGGLLPAVVESWYPHCNDSYGLLLEDDVELSPLAYAWVKMTLLRYKYGNSSPFSSQLFGISLYQQKVIELRPIGRQPFNARTLFRSSSLVVDPTTPYLSQIPCSWGALYFPSHWREFHDYLSLRLSQRDVAISHTIVPGVRSNKWRKSWKKYFIEFVYLRGYVMLYPNYDGFVSLSTNHLEVGSHVRDEPGEVYERKKQLFSLPLMRLAGALASTKSDSDSASLSPSPVGDAARGPRLLDLPGEALPDWEQLPVLDLVGEVSSMEAIRIRGDERRSELDTCAISAVPPPLSVRDLFCRLS